jgi:hypothetical protein
MTKHVIAKRDGINRAESNSILRPVLIEEAVREYLGGKPRTLRLLLEGHCDVIERGDAESVEAKIGA